MTFEVIGFIVALLVVGGLAYFAKKNKNKNTGTATGPRPDDKASDDETGTKPQPVDNDDETGTKPQPVDNDDETETDPKPNTPTAGPRPLPPEDNDEQPPKNLRPTPKPFSEIFGREFGEVDPDKDSFYRSIDFKEIHRDIYKGRKLGLPRTYSLILLDDQKQQLFATQLSSVHGIRIERVADQKARWPEGGWVQDYIDEKVGLPDDQFAVFPTTSIKNAELSGIPFEAGKKYTLLFKQNATGFTAGFTFVGVLPKKAVQVIAVGAGQGFKLNFTFF